MSSDRAAAASSVSAAGVADATASASSFVPPPPSPCGSVLQLGVDAASRSAMRIVRDRFASRGHLDDAWTATVRVADPAATPPASRCTVWIEEQSRSGGATEVVLGLESPDDAAAPRWFFVASPDGAILRRGPLPDCIGCHAAATRGVFSGSETVTRAR